MRKHFDDLPPAMQLMVTDITAMLNNKEQPPERDYIKIPILKPFNFAAMDDETTAGECPKWIAHFNRAKRLTATRGRYVFDYLVDG